MAILMPPYMHYSGEFMRFLARMIVSGRITQEAVIEADTPAQAAWAMDPPPRSDPALPAGSGKPVAWVEVKELREGE